MVAVLVLVQLLSAAPAVQETVMSDPLARTVNVLEADPPGTAESETARFRAVQEAFGVRVVRRDSVMVGALIP